LPGKARLSVLISSRPERLLLALVFLFDPLVVGLVLVLAAAILPLVFDLVLILLDEMDVT
jgi:hypothetical protein